MPYTIDQYTTVRTLGSGISAKVKLATGPNGKTVAIKVFDKKNPHNDAKMLSNLQKEVETLLKLKHSNIV
jgi:serine/threonine protein kinase